MDSGKRRWLAVTAILAVLVVAIVAVLRLFGGEPPRRTEERPASARFTRPVIVSSRQGVRQWSLEADVIEDVTEGSRRLARITRITEGALYQDGDVTLRFTADEGVWDQSSGELELSGNVRFFRDDQEIRARRMVVEVGAEVMRFLGDVEWHGESGTIRAEEAVYRSKEEVVEFFGRGSPVSLVISEE